MTSEIKVGIVGAGVIGEVHAKAIAEVDGARVAAVAEPQEEKGRPFAVEHGAEWFADLADLLGRSEVDVVAVCTPSGLHAEQAILAAGAGKHVVSEKPMATSLETADRMIAACQAAGVSLAVIFQTRFSRHALRLKRAVDAGLFGQPVLGNAVVHWRRTPEYYQANGGWRGTWALDGGGALMNQSIHTIDLLQWVLGPVSRIAAETATLRHRIEAEDTASATLRFASGALGTIQGTTAASQDWPARLEIVGTEGRAVLDGSALAVWQPSRLIEDDELLGPDDLAATAGWQPEESLGAGHARQWTAIRAALTAGKLPPVPGEEARKAVAIILAIYESATTGQPVTVGDGG